MEKLFFCHRKILACLAVFRMERYYEICEKCLKGKELWDLETKKSPEDSISGSTLIIRCLCECFEGIVKIK